MYRAIVVYGSLALLSSGLASAADATWTGSGGNARTSNVNNWNPVGSPQGASLVFPFGKAASVTQDITALAVSSITFAGPSPSPNPWILTPSPTPSPNPILLGAGGLNVEYVSSALNEITCDLQLTADQTWTYDGTLQHGGVIDLNGHNLTITDNANPGGASLGVITGTGNLTKGGSGASDLSGSAANSYSGTVTVTGGSLALNKPAGVVAITGGLTVTAGTVSYNANDQIADGANVTTAAGGTFSLGPYHDTIGALDNDGTLDLFTGKLTVTASSVSNGHISGDATTRLICSGAGTSIALNGGSSGFLGVLEVDCDSATIGAVIGSSVQLNAGSTLKGAGQIGALTSTGGIIQLGGGKSLRVDGDLTLDPATSYVVRVLDDNGSYDQLLTDYAAHLDGTLTVDLDSGVNPAPGEKIRVINNLTNDPVSGTFTGLPEGSTLTAGGHSFRISYQGGDGNDVELTCADPVPDDGVIGDLGVMMPPADLANAGDDLATASKSSSSGGCSCQVSGQGATAGPWLFFGLFALVVARRRLRA